MAGGKRIGGRGSIQIMVGAAALAAGTVILLLPILVEITALLLLAAGLLIMGTTKVLGAFRATHVAWYIRAFGVSVGILFFVVFGVVLFEPIVGLVLVELILVIGLVVYGVEEIAIGIDSTFPRNERIFLTGVGVGAVALAVVLVVVPGAALDLLILATIVTLFAVGLGSIIRGVNRLRPPELLPSQEGIEVPLHGSDVAARPSGRGAGSRLHCFVIGSRAEIVASLGRLVRQSTPKIQQGGLAAEREANLTEADLFRKLQAYAEAHGDLTSREAVDWALVQETWEDFRKRSVRKIQWVRPIGTLTSKARIARVAYALRETPLDLRSRQRPGLAPIGVGTLGGALSDLVSSLRASSRAIPVELLDRIQAEFGLLRGGLRSYGAYILHIVGAPVDVDSDSLGDLFVDDVPLLWDFGASHTEIGALDPTDHLISATTNFLLGPAILFQHFYAEGRPVALVRKGHTVRVGWARHREVVHRTEAIDVEAGYKRGDITLPPPISRGAELRPTMPPDQIQPQTLEDSGREGRGGSGVEPEVIEGIASRDLHQAGVEGLDWALVYMMMEGEFTTPKTTASDA